VTTLLRRSAIALVLLAACREETAREGRWKLVTLVTLPEAGARQEDLIRIGKGRVAHLVSSVRFYRNDCVIYISRETSPVWCAVCGDQTPLVLSPYTYDNEWFTADDGLRRWRRVISNDAAALLEEEVFSLEELSAGTINPRITARPIRGDETNSATGEPIWVYTIRTNTCEALPRMPGLSINAVDPHYGYPIIFAIERDDVCAVNALIKRGADLRVRSFEGDNVLTAAVNRRNVGLVRLLLERPEFDRAALNEALQRSRKLGQPEITPLLNERLASFR
jgi:hypothetical protein